MLWRGLTFQLFLLTILPLTALLLLITFGSLRLHQNAMRMMVGERDARAVVLAARALEARIEDRARAVRGLSERAAGADAAQLGQILADSEAILTDFNAGTAFWHSNGKLAQSSGDLPMWQSLAADLARRPGTLPQAGNAHQPVYLALDGYRSLAVFFIAPESEWVAAGAFSLDDLLTAMLSDGLSSGHDTNTMLVDAAGSLVYQSGLPPEGKPGDHAGVAEALRGEQGILYLPTGDGEHVVAYSPVSPPGWALVVEEPWEMVVTPVLSNTQFAPLVLVPVLLLAMLALGFGLRQVVQPLQALESKLAALSWGDYSAIEEPVGGIEEIHRLQNELVHLARKVQAAQQGLRGYIGAITAAQEDERRRMARELHDDTLQALIALKQRLQLAQLSGTDAASAASFNEIEELSEQTIQNLRRLTRALRPIYLEDLGLEPALEVLAREASASMGIPVNFESQGSERRLEADAELALYRMAQEALNNVARHAQARQAWLKIAFSTGKVELEISDDGIGFQVPKSPAEFAPSGHFGLLGLHERAEMVGASLVIEF